MAKLSLSQIQEAEQTVAKFRLLVDSLVKAKGYMYLDKQSKEVCVAVEEWLHFMRAGV